MKEQQNVTLTAHKSSLKIDVSLTNGRVSKLVLSAHGQEMTLVSKAGDQDKAGEFLRYLSTETPLLVARAKEIANDGN